MYILYFVSQVENLWKHVYERNETSHYIPGNHLYNPQRKYVYNEQTVRKAIRRPSSWINVF